MKKGLLTSVLFLCFGQYLVAQTFDTTSYLHLLKADRIEFLHYADSIGMTTGFDTTSESSFAKIKGFLYTKPTGEKNNNENYDLVLIVSTQNKENIKFILRDAKEYTDKKDFWSDNQYLYREWDMKNPISHEMWYRILIYKKKQ